MLKFQPNYTTSISDFEEFFITVYIFIGALYQRYVPKSISTRPNVEYSKTPNSEMVTIRIYSKIAKIDSENAGYTFVKKNYGFLFLNLCSYTCFYQKYKPLL